MIDDAVARVIRSKGGFIWALKKRGELDGLLDLVSFANSLEKACIDTLLDGYMTKDLVNLVDASVKVKSVKTTEFIKQIKTRLSKAV